MVEKEKEEGTLVCLKYKEIDLYIKFLFLRVPVNNKCREIMIS